MPTLSASPNPVVFYSATAPATTTVRWNTEGRFSGIVYVSINGGKAEPLPGQGSGAPSGTGLTLPVSFGSVYRLSLKRADDTSVELASVIVTTSDLRAQIAEGFSQAYLPQLRPQMITNLVVTPGVDTVRVSFRTTRPTIPTIGIYDANGAYLDGRMPLFGGLQTKHGAEFGVDRPLALGSKHKIVIDAFGATGNASSPRKVTQTVEFISGTRSADVTFENVDVHDDGDTGASGAGEIVFSFGVGDRSTGQLIGPSVQWPAVGVAEISDDDGQVDIGVTLPIPAAPRIIWAQVIATDDDSGTLPGQDAVRFFLPPKFEEEGSRYFVRAAAAHASVTVSIDLGTESGRFAIPFEMMTGDFPLDYVMSGHIFVRAKEGAVISTKVGMGGPAGWRSSFLTEPGDAVRLAAAGAANHGHLVALGADGAVHYLPSKAELREKQKTWTRIELPCAGTIAVAASPTGTINLVGADSDGAPIHREFDPAAPKRGKWRKLAGRFREVHPAFAARSGRGAAAKLLLFGLGHDGSLHVCDDADRDDWSRLGDEPVRAIASAPLDAARPAVFAAAENGTLLSFERDKGRWRQRALARIQGEIAPQLLTVVPVDQVDAKSGKISRDLVIGTMSEDYRVFTLRWPDYPIEKPEDCWQELGSVQDLLVEKPATPAKRRRESRKQR